MECKQEIQLQQQSEQAQVSIQTLGSKIYQEDLLQTQLSVQTSDPLQFNQVLPLQSMDTIKLELQPQLPQLAQVVVSTGAQLDMSEPLLMCPPTLMFDSSQIIPPQFVQVHSHNLHNHQGHFL